jgi:hypothetical protein
VSFLCLAFRGVLFKEPFECRALFCRTAVAVVLAEKVRWELGGVECGKDLRERRNLRKDDLAGLSIAGIVTCWLLPLMKTRAFEGLAIGSPMLYIIAIQHSCVKEWLRTLLARNSNHEIVLTKYYIR